MPAAMLVASLSETVAASPMPAAIEVPCLSASIDKFKGLDRALEPLMSAWSTIDETMRFD